MAEIEPTKKIGIENLQYIAPDSVKYYCVNCRIFITMRINDIHDCEDYDDNKDSKRD